MLVLLFIFFSLLGVITKHNETQKVPSVLGKRYNEAKQLLEAAKFKTAIQDSVYVDTASASQVMRQSPDADAVVKANRTVFLTINRAVPPEIEMPDLRGFSLKSADLYLQSLGLKIGDTSYVYDIAKNAVKDQLLNGKSVAPGTKVNMGTSIELVIGNGIGNRSINVPDLVGMTVAEARDFLSSNNIELGAIIPLDNVTNPEDSYIIRQKPEKYSKIAEGESIINKIRPGQIMDVWVSTEPPANDSIPK